MSQSSAIRVEMSDVPRSIDRALRQRLDEVERQLEAVLAVVGTDGTEDSVRKLPANASRYSMIRSILRARRAREQHFESGLFADPAWDMLLELYAARIAQQRVSVSALCAASAVPPTTGLRWISTLELAGLVHRRNDPLDGRRIFVELTPKGEQAMSDVFKEPETAVMI